MRIRLLLALFLFPIFPFCAFSQDYFPVKGQVVNTRGEAVEYVQVGVPGLQIGTISSPDGQFEISVPKCTLEFFHVSYKPASLSVTGATSDVVIVLEDEELPPAVFVGGNTKAKYLLRPGSKLPGGVVSFSLQEGRPRGRELGSVAVVRKPFLVKDIHLSVHSNHIPGCVSAINIYRIDKGSDKTESFVNVLHRPMYFDVEVSDKPQDIVVSPEETLLLEPGKYFIAFQIVDCNQEALRAFLQSPKEERKNWEMTMDFIIHFKSSYLREAALGEMEYLPINIGIAVRGLEYQ